MSHFIDQWPTRLRSSLPLVVGSGLALLLLSSCGGFSFEVTIPRALVEKQVARKFPTVKSKGVMTVKIANPVLDFQGSRNRLGVDADAEVRILGLIPMRGNMKCDGSLAYNPGTGALHFTDIQIQSFEINGLPRSKADELTGLLTSAAISALGGLEIYKLDPDDSKEKLARLALKSIRVTDQGIVARLGLGKAE